MLLIALAHSCFQHIVYVHPEWYRGQDLNLRMLNPWADISILREMR